MAFLKKLGIAIAVSIGIGLLALAIGYYLSTTGGFVQWQSLGRPPEGITKIVGTTMSSVTVETSSQKLYTRDTSSLGGTWVESLEIPNDPYSEHFQCGQPELSKDMIDIQESCFFDPGGKTESIFALRKDGNIYLWYGSKGLGEWGWVALLYFCFPLAAIVGFVGVWIYFFVSWLRILP
jgi:hypothetical protein